MSADFGRPQGMLASVLAVVALILGVLGIYFGLNASKVKGEMADRLAGLEERLTQVAQQSETASAQVRDLGLQCQRNWITIGTKLQDLESKANPTPPVARTSGGVSTPTAEGAGDAAGTYAVKAGDTPDKIAKKHNVTTAALMKANPGLDARRMKVNQKIKIPAAAPAAPAAPAAAPASR